MTGLKIGEIDVTVVSDGRVLLAPETMFGPAQPPEWRPLVQLENGRVPFSVNCLLVRAGGRLILLDTGTGRDEPSFLERYGPGSGLLRENLHALGVEPSAIDVVVLSHAHADHVGGATVRRDERFVPAFPRATYWLWQREWDHWTTPEALASRPFLGRKLIPLGEQGRLTLTETEDEVAPGVRLIAAPGHTPGHICVAITSGREMAIYAGDLLHHSAQCRHPDWCPAFDLLPEMSAASRRRILERAMRERAFLLTAHLPTPGIARPTAGGEWQTDG